MRRGGRLDESVASNQANTLQANTARALAGKVRRMVIDVSREVLADMLRQHGEDALAERALSLSDDELARIGTLGAYYAWSEDALALGGGMGGARALSLATIDVLEDTGRDLRSSRTEWEREESPVDRFAEDDAARDRELRRHATERQIPADKSKVTLDTVDPPAWGPAPPGATSLIKRCHELRTKPLVDFTVEDLRLMIGQQVGLTRLVGLAHRRLRADPLVQGDYYPGDLLASVLGVDGAFWERSPDLDVEVGKLAKDLRGRTELEPGLRELIDTFIRDHSARRRMFRNDPERAIALIE
jgi:hypothetical protein